MAGLGNVKAKCNGNLDPPRLQEIKICLLAISAATLNLKITEGSLNSKLPTIWRVEKQMKSR